MKPILPGVFRQAFTSLKCKNTLSYPTIKARAQLTLCFDKMTLRWGFTFHLELKIFIGEPLIFKPRSYSIQGTSRSEPTLAGGNNVFTEEVKDGTIKTSDPWHLSLAFEYKLISEDKFFVDIGWKSPEHKDVEFEERHSTAAMLTTSLGYEKKWTERILLLGGGRWMRTFSESAADSKNQTFLVTSGIIRKFKTVELGTTLGYFIQNNEAYDKNTGSFSPASRFTGFDIAFSSAFSY